MNHIGWGGLTYWVSEAKGNEKIGVGIRPYGLHAGNMAAVIAYPYLLCERYEDINREKPEFRLQIWLNDIEPVKYVGADGTRESANAANMYPGSTTFQFMPAPNGHKGSLADFWQPVIEGVVRGTIGARFPYVKLDFRRASELVGTPEFEKTVLSAMHHSAGIGRVIGFFTQTPIQGKKGFVWPLCPDCHAPVTDATLKKSSEGLLIDGWHKFMGNYHFSQKAKNLSWAMQFRMLQAARLAAEQPDLWVIGIDHFPTNRTSLMEHLAAGLGIDQYRGDFLHVPLLFADGSKKLSKSLGNAVYMSPQELINALRKNRNQGLDVKHAPVSDDIIVVGADLLPRYMTGNKEVREAALKAKMAAYEKSNKRKAFLSDNAPGAISNKFVVRTVGVPHL
ncbi:MAG: hypothetical protein P4M13_05920 [Alphaproteobacteria bacterium]|nr:hypothetical protein [Alphaproteobacteria bacterium]